MAIHEFYAVTTTSVYLVSDKIGENGCPIVEKIARDAPSSVEVGGRLRNGKLVAVAKDWIFLYSDPHSRDYERHPENINTRHWGGHTSGLIGLFLRKEEAMDCFRSGDKKVLDPRWRAQTEEVRRRIGNDHPVFILTDL